MRTTAFKTAQSEQFKSRQWALFIVLSVATIHVASAAHDQCHLWLKITAISRNDYDSAGDLDFKDKLNQPLTFRPTFSVVVRKGSAQGIYENDEYQISGGVIISQGSQKGYIKLRPDVALKDNLKAQLECEVGGEKDFNKEIFLEDVTDEAKPWLPIHEYYGKGQEGEEETVLAEVGDETACSIAKFKWVSSASNQTDNLDLRFDLKSEPEESEDNIIENKDETISELSETNSNGTNTKPESLSPSTRVLRQRGRSKRCIPPAFTKITKIPCTIDLEAQQALEKWDAINEESEATIAHKIQSACDYLMSFIRWGQ